MEFDDALAYLQGLRRFGIKLGNERFQALLARIGNPHGEYGIAHVTGTKGKGSVTAMIAAILSAHGFQTGGYYSPYVYDVCERVQVDGALIPRAEFARLITEIRPHVEELAATPLGQITEFEMKTAVGFRYFADRKVDFAAVEVGIGGRLDATNVVTPLVSVITNVGMDHMTLLGNTIEKIAFEKAGIIKRGVPVVTAAIHPEALPVIRRIAGERDAPLTLIQDETCMEPQDGERFTLRTRRGAYQNLRLSLRGDYQRLNAACAVSAVEEIAAVRGFTVDPRAVRAALAEVYLPGRFDVIRRSPMVIADGAHNGISAQALAMEVRKLSYRRLLLVIGMVTGHDPEDVVAALAPMASRVYATRPLWNRGLPAEVVAESARRHCSDTIVVIPPQEAARQALADAEADDLVLITGSFYTVGDVPRAALAGPASERR